MSTVPGQDAKDKGNAAFKSGDFPAAIGHYTAAVLADPKNPTYTLNRAAAYLRLGKNEDAERDCDLTIKLDQKNVKAWFRRGQARAGQEKFEGAKSDYKQSLQLDPKNDAASQELAKVEALLQFRAANAGKKRVPVDLSGPKASIYPLPSTPTAVAPKRRRVPIKIVDSSDVASSSSSSTPVSSATGSTNATATPTSSASDSLIKPVSTRKLSSSSSPSATATSSKATSFKDLKQARETNKASPSFASSSTAPPPTSSPTPSPGSVKTGGGIFRSNGQHTIFGSNSQGTTTPKDNSFTAPAPPPSQSPIGGNPKNTTSATKTPITLFNFTRTWNSLSTPQEKWIFLLENVPPAALPAMFKTSLEAPILVSILEVFKSILEGGSEPNLKATVKTYLLDFSRVPRFSTVVLFMSKDEKRLVKDVWDCVDIGDNQVERGARKVWGIS